MYHFSGASLARKKLGPEWWLIFGRTKNFSDDTEFGLDPFPLLHAPVEIFSEFYRE